MSSKNVFEDDDEFAQIPLVIIDKSASEKAVKVAGSAFNEEIYGSDFSDLLKGNGGDDKIWAGSGNDQIHGGVGRDYLYGEDGKDSFVFNTKPGSTNLDHIGDFRSKDDTIKLDNAIFSWDGQELGRIEASEFKVIGNGQRVDANDHILYNEKTGALFYDVDGAGGVKPVAVAVLDNFSGDVPIVTHNDILII